MADSLIFEPCGGFRSDIGGEEWPLGFISQGIGKPLFALHEVAGGHPVEELLAHAQMLATAPDEVERLRRLNSELVTSHNAQNQHGAKLDEKIRQLTERRGKLEDALADAIEQIVSLADARGSEVECSGEELVAHLRAALTEGYSL